MINLKYYTRVLTKEDISYLKDLEQIEFLTQKSPWAAQEIADCYEDTYKLIALFCKDKVIGFSVIYNTRVTTDLLTIGVLTQYQGQHLGQMLLLDTLKEALNVKAIECFLEVRVSNVVAQNLYKKFGFKQVGIRKEYYSAQNGHAAEDAYTMQLADIASAVEKLS